MADPVKGDPRKQREPRLTGNVIIDTWRGQPRERAWPRKTGRETNPARLSQIRFIRFANRAFNYWAASQRAIAEQWTKNTPYVPRDLFMLSIQGKLYNIHLPDGRVLEPRRSFLEEAVFQGVILQQVDGVPLANNVRKVLDWPLPIIDTFDFWNVANPSRITIPEGVAVVNLIGSMGGTGAGGGDKIFVIIDKNGAPEWIAAPDVNATHGIQVVTGPIVVEPGDIYELALQTVGYSTTTFPARTYFKLEVLGTEI